MTEDRELHIGRGGLWIPPELREFEQQIVFRTPRSTIQHFGSQPLEGYYGMIDESHFGDDVDDGQNPSLAPDRVSIKPQGEDAREFRVETDPDVRCDGGQSDIGTDQYDTLLRSMNEGLLVSVNNSAYSATPSFELRVEHSRDDETHVSLSGPGDSWYRIYRDRRGDLIYSEVTEDGLSYEDDVVTLEIIGLDERPRETGADSDD